MTNLYELRISIFKGIEFNELKVEKETPKQFKVSGSKMFRNTINKSETERISTGAVKSEYHVWFTDLADLPRFKQELIEQLQDDLDGLLERAGELETQIEDLNKLGVK